MPREKSTSKGGAVGGDGRITALRKERLNKSKKELAEEAKRVLRQVERVDCISSPRGVNSEKFYTLQNRKKKKEYFSGSLDRHRNKSKSLEIVPPKKPPRTFAATKYPQKPSVFDIFKKEKPPAPKKSNLRRSASDSSTATNKTGKFRKRSGSDSAEFLKKNQKKQLSPIIEITQREDYFSAPELDYDKEQNKENVAPKTFVRKKKKETITEQLKQFIDEVDEELYKETGVRVSPDPKEEQKPPQPIIIDVEKAEQISNKGKKFKRSFLARKLKKIAQKKKITNEGNKAKKSVEFNIKHPINKEEEINSGILIKETINNLKNPKESPKMIHSSQMPPEKLPLTKGRKVNSLVKRLSSESASPPPLKTNITIAPHPSVQHNNNQPFSYTRGLSPEKFLSNETSPTSSSPIIYAQVICGSSKQTVHKTYKKNRTEPFRTHSDSDEGLGYEEHFKTSTRLGDDEVDNKFQEDSPIAPNFRKEVRYLDSSARGRGDGMDSKKRDSYVESHFASTLNRSDLTARRDQLESRINRRVTDNSIRTSPEYLKNPTNIHVSETTSKQSSPTGYTGKTYGKETKFVQYGFDGFDNEPKSFDSQMSSSPENRNYRMKSAHSDVHYKHKRSNYYYEENDRRDRFVDSGIENDFRRDSADNFARSKRRTDYCNESDDEGFASSLLIASERQHTEENVSQRKNPDYDSDRAVSREDDPYRGVETMDYKSKTRSTEYVPRERSIDDGSHYDPRIDKNVEVFTLRKSEKKPPKPEKKSGLDKVKSLFTRDTKKRKEQVAMVPEENLRARYIEYKGRGEPVGYKIKKQEVSNHVNRDYDNRRRLSTPSPSPTRDRRNGGKPESTHGSWFKSLDRLSRKKSKKGEKESNFASGTEEESPSKPTKNLRFFGDTDQESSDSMRHKTSTKTRSRLPSRSNSQSTRDLHNISEEFKAPRSRYKSMTNVSESEREHKISLKPPMSPNRRTPRDLSRQDKDRTRRRKNEVSSVESSTEGESSQQSQRSIVYLHAATVGDIPGPGYMKTGRRAASREELASNGGRVQQVKTLSRSFSVLAPWKPRNSRDSLDIDYSKSGKNGKFEQKVSKSPSHRKENSSTLKKKTQESKRKETGSTLLKLSKSKENLASQTLGRSRDDLSKGSNSTLFKKKDRLPRENSRYNRDKEEKKISAKSLSVESLGGEERRNGNRNISRSVSMPRDPEKSAGWFKISKKAR